MTTQTFVGQFEPIECRTCGITYGVPPNWRRTRYETGREFHCPNGHTQQFAEPETARLRKALSAERAAHDQTKSRAQDAEAAKARLEEQAKLRDRRSAAGVCPCCHRTFSQMARHMKTKHPEFVSEKGGPKP